MAADGIPHKNRPVLWELNLFATIFIVYGPSSEVMRNEVSDCLLDENEMQDINQRADQLLGYYGVNTFYRENNGRS